MEMIIKFVKSLILWALVIFYTLAAIVYLSVGGKSTLSGILAILFVIIMFPLTPWKTLIDSHVNKTVKSLVAVILAFLTFAVYPIDDPSNNPSIPTDGLSIDGLLVETISTSNSSPSIETTLPLATSDDPNLEDEFIIDTSSMSVRFDTDYIDGKQLHITVFTKNNSNYIFTGNVHVYFDSTDGKDYLGSDCIIVKNLLPGHESWADVIVDFYYGTPKMTVDFSEVFFVPLLETAAELDLIATESTKNDFRLYFDGTSWYNDVIDIVVYTDGSCIVTIKPDAKNAGFSYAAAVMGVGTDHGVKVVRVIDSNGVLLAVY